MRRIVLALSVVLLLATACTKPAATDASSSMEMDEAAPAEQMSASAAAGPSEHAGEDMVAPAGSENAVPPGSEKEPLAQAAPPQASGGTASWRYGYYGHGSLRHFRVRVPHAFSVHLPHPLHLPDDATEVVVTGSHHAASHDESGVESATDSGTTDMASTSKATETGGAVSGESGSGDTGSDAMNSGEGESHSGQTEGAVVGGDITGGITVSGGFASVGEALEGDLQPGAVNQDAAHSITVTAGGDVNLTATTPPAPKTYWHYVSFDPVAVVAGAPREPGAAARLKSGVHTSLRYRLTQHEPQMALGVARAVASPEVGQALESRSDTIEVAFHCSVCDPRDNRQPSRRLTLAEFETNTVTFGFKIDKTRVPTGTPAAGDMPPGIRLDLAKNGVPYKEVYLCVNVDDIPQLCSGNADMTETACGDKAGSACVSVAGADDDNDNDKEAVLEAQPDATIELSNPPAVSNADYQVDPYIHLTIELHPQTAYFGDILAQLRHDGHTALADRLARDPTPSVVSGVATAQDLSMDSDDFVVRVECMATTSAAVKAFLEASVYDCSKLGPDDLKDAVERHGSLWYQDLFSDEADTVMHAMLAVSHAKLAAKAPPLKILFQSRLGVRLPFQLFTPCDACSADLFGLSFEIVEASSEGTRKVANSLGAPAANPLVATYIDIPPESTDVGQAAKVEFASLTKALAKMDTREVTNISSGADFYRKFKADTATLSLIWFYGHGEGRYNGGASDGEPMGYNAADGSADAKLYFHKTSGGEDYLTARQIATAKFDHDAKLPFLPRQPLVVLIACEVGAVNPYGRIGTNMTQAFLRSGAGGVIATEAPVEANSSMMLSDYLIEGIFGAQPMSPSLALFYARRTVYLQSLQTENQEPPKPDYWPLLFYYTAPWTGVRQKPLANRP